MSNKMIIFDHLISKIIIFKAKLLERGLKLGNLLIVGRNDYQNAIG